LSRYGGDQAYYEEIKQFYYRDEFSHQVQEWNRQRTLAIERSLKQFLYPQMAKELKNKLIAEAKENIIKVLLPPLPPSYTHTHTRIHLLQQHLL
jgi:transcriptional accessory protein Tex/SPT6